MADLDYARLVDLAIPDRPADDGRDDTTVLRETRRHGLLATAHEVAVARGWPASTCTRLREARERAVRDALDLAGLLGDLARSAAEAGVPLIALKGPALSIGLFGDVGRRQARDLDVLVPTSGIGPMATRLESLGFGLAPPWPAWPAAELARRASSHHQFPFLDPGGRIVELHTRLVGPTMGPAKAFTELWAARRMVRVAGVEVPVPSWEDTALHLAVHGFGHGWERLGWIADIAALSARSDVDWARAVADARAMRRRVALDGAFVLAHALIRAPLPLTPTRRGERAGLAVARRIEQHEIRPTPGAWLADHVRSREGWRDVALHAWRIWTEPSISDLDGDTWPPPRLSLLWRRPVRLVRQHLLRRGGGAPSAGR